LLAALVSPALSRAQGNFICLTNYPKNSNIQTNLIKQFPTGLWFATNAFATPFDIVASSNGGNFEAISSSMTYSVFIPAVSNVYTLMNAYTPGSGIVAIIQFYGDAGAAQTFNLQGGVNIRDFYQGQYVNSINNSTTENAFEIFDVQDAGESGNVNTGLTGDYVVDEQAYALNPAFLTQNLTNIVVSGNNQGTPIVLGITAQSVGPAIAKIVQSGSNLTFQATGGVSNATCVTLSTTNLLEPVNQWTPVATNVFSASGNFSVTVTNAMNSSTSAQFFVMEMH
jgi:hypothetical protein